MELRKNMESGFSVSGDGTERLRTHLWHAKRFTMVKRWGFYLPLGLHGRGRGSRALLKRLKSGALLHDASYCCPIQLEGPEDSLLAVLRMVLVPSPSEVPTEISQPVIHGICYESAMLHHIGTPLSQLIAPIIFMWRPVSKDRTNANVEMDHILNGDGELSISYRQLWIWVHAAAFSEGFNVLATACQKQMDEDGVLLNCISLKGKLAKLEVMGSEATKILHKILCLSSESSSGSENSLFKGHSSLIACCSRQQNKSVPCEQADPLSSHANMKDCPSFICKKSVLLGQAEHLPSHAILSLNVLDPRDLPSKRGVEPAPLTSLADLPCDLLKEISKDSNASSPISPNLSGEDMLSLWSKPKENATFISDSKMLWVHDDRLQAPAEESALCLEKHHRRLKYFYLNNTNSIISTNESQGCSSRTCSVLLLKHNYQKKSHQGWSIILPLSWVKSFWIPLVSHGAYAIGLRERHWVASDAGVPCFPFDFPDCKSYSLFMSVEACETNQIAETCPISMRPSRIPIPPPWDCVRSSVEEGPGIMGGFQAVGEQLQCGAESVPSTSSVYSHMQICKVLSHDNSTISFQGSIARTASVLSYCLKKNYCSHLLLFPNTEMSKKAFSELMDKGKVNWVLRSINKLSADRPLYFSRVLLHPYRDGVFEEGAVVCAPVISDFSLLALRSEDLEKLQIPQSMINNYFTENESGRWLLQVPDDSSTRQSFRWPIGFVTSGFVRGSAHPVALAMCEVMLLAQLREKQWSEMQEKGRPEIFVLVRNLRSTAYRLSRATIVLEQGDDVDFM